MRIKRANLKERLHFLLTGEIQGYWSKARTDIHRVYFEMLNSDSEKSPFNGWPEEQKNTLKEFFGCSKISYEQAKPFLRRHIKECSTTPDYFPEEETNNIK